MAASCDPGYNLPDGCTDAAIDRHFGEGRPTCAECKRMVECCCDYGICEFEFEEAFDEEAGKRPLPAWEAACWARDWIVEHYKDMQEDTCERCDG